MHEPSHGQPVRVLIDPGLDESVDPDPPALSVPVVLTDLVPSVHQSPRRPAGLPPTTSAPASFTSPPKGPDLFWLVGSGSEGLGIVGCGWL